MTEDRSRVGVAVIARGDERAMRLTMASLVAQGDRIDRVVVAAMPAPAGRTPADIGDYASQAFCFETLSHAFGNPREAAFAALREHDMALILDEGVLLKSDFIDGESAAFATRAGLAARMLTAESAADINALPAAANMLPTDQLLKRFARRRGKLAPLYFTPTILMLRPKCCPQAGFDRFSNRSGWAAARLFIDGLLASDAADHIVSHRFGYCGAEPDRRAGYQQGRLCCKELYMMANAFPRYRATAESDIRRLAFAQALKLATGQARQTTLLFLKGLVDEMLWERTTRRRLAADVRSLG